MKLFLQKKCKIFNRWGLPPPHPRASGGWGLCPQTPSLRRLGASPPDPHWPPAAGGSAPRPPKQPPPHCEFLATRLHWCQAAKEGCKWTFRSSSRVATQQRKTQKYDSESEQYKSVIFTEYYDMEKLKSVQKIAFAMNLK